MDQLLQIGGAKPETIREMKDLILSIMNCGGEQETIKYALSILPDLRLGNVDNMTIANNNFINNVNEDCDVDEN